MEKVYIIGGSGFIGKNLAAYLSESMLVTVFDKEIDESFFSKHQSIKTHRIDLANEIISLDFTTPEYIINLASVVTADRDLTFFDELVRSNIKILINLHARFGSDANLKLFVQFGSSEEYGNIGSPFVESVREEPSSPYALIKQLTTNTVMMLARNNNFPAIVVRPGNLFGYFQSDDKFIPYIIKTLKANADLNVTPCEQRRDFIFIDDFVWLINELLNNASKCLGHIVNVASGESTSLKEIIEHCKEQIGSSSQINYGAIAYRTNEMMDLKCDLSMLKLLIGKDFRFNLFDKLTQLIDQ